MDKEAYAEAIKRKDEQIKQLKEEKEVLLKTLVKKEEDIRELNRRFQNLSL